jgi:dipeptidyl aminopeptidase/acylaminoacyl peptidase
MRHILAISSVPISGFLVLLLASGLQASSLPYLDDLPDLIDREVFFDDPEISSARLSPDGQYVSFIRPWQGVRNIWIKSIDERFDQARPLTADDKPVPGYFWSQDGNYVLYVQDRGGDENFQVWAVEPSADPDEQSGVPEARNLTDLDGVRANIIAVPNKSSDRILVGINDRDPALHDVYALTLSTGERELLIRNDDNIAGWSADLDGDVRLAQRQTRDGGTEILEVIDGRLGEPVYACGWEETCTALRFFPDGQRVWLQSNRGEEVDLIGLYVMDLESGEVELFERDPVKEADFAGAIFAPDSHRLMATIYVGDQPRIYPQTDEFAKELAFLRKNLPEGQITIPSQSSDGHKALISLSRDIDPGTVYLLDREQQSLEKLYRARPEVPVQAMAGMQPIRYTARDGLEIPAYLTVPAGIEPEKLAVVALIHGGPWSRDHWGYRANVQFLANRGYAVFQPNFRASTGFGKSFLNAGNREWGDAMQDDITDGIQYLVDQGIADPDRVCIMGGSYGGYATLAGMTFTPATYACGINIVGISNLITLINSIPPYWGPIRQMFIQRMGDPDTPEGRARLERQSPINHVYAIDSPLLIIHGANDPRVRQTEADQIVVAMREAGLPVEYMVAPDEGHGFRGRENRLAMYARVERFLANHLGGRYQADMSDETAKRLEAITIDIEQVEVMELADELVAAATRPLPVVNGSHVAQGRLEYLTTVAIAGNPVEIPTTRTVRDDECHDDCDDHGDDVSDDKRHRLIVSNESRTPMGKISDHFELDARTLRPIQRKLQQGPATLSLKFGSREVTGQLEAGEDTSAVHLQLPAPVFGPDVALEIALTGLELEAGWSGPLRSVEIGMQQRVRHFRLEVGAPESIEVAAGSFEAWPLNLTAMDGHGGDMQLWLTVESPRRIVRMAGQLPPEAGGGSYMTELTDFVPE